MGWPKTDWPKLCWTKVGLDHFLPRSGFLQRGPIQHRAPGTSPIRQKKIIDLFFDLGQSSSALSQIDLFARPDLFRPVLRANGWRVGPTVGPQRVAPRRVVPRRVDRPKFRSFFFTRLSFPVFGRGKKKREIFGPQFGAPPNRGPAPLVEGRLGQKAKTPIWAKDGFAKVGQLRMAKVGSAKVGISLLLGTGTTYRIGNSFLGVHSPVLTVESWLKCRNCEMRNALVAAWSHKGHV